MPIIQKQKFRTSGRRIRENSNSFPVDRHETKYSQTTLIVEMAKNPDTSVCKKFLDLFTAFPRQRSSLGANINKRIRDVLDEKNP